MQGDRYETTWRDLEENDPVSIDGVRGVWRFKAVRMMGRKVLWVKVYGGRTDRMRAFRFFPPATVHKLKETKQVRQRQSDADRLPSLAPRKRKERR
jgi:hypothetical protein